MQDAFDWDLLRSFLAVARAGKLTKGARRLGVDHSTLSRRITVLEARLHTKLFDRRPSGYTLTQQGERLLARAEEMETSVLGIHAEVAPDNTQVSGVVRIGAPDGFGATFIAPRIGRLTEMHPGLEIELVVMPRSFSLSRREADIAIGLSAPEQGRLHVRKLTDYELGVYAARGGTSPQTEAIRHAGDLAGRSFVSYIDDLIFAPELDYLPTLAVNVSARLRSSNLIAQQEAAAAGAGLCMLPCFLADRDPRLVRLLPSELHLRRTFFMVVHSDMKALARIRAVTDFVAESVRREAHLFLPADRP